MRKTAKPQGADQALKTPEQVRSEFLAAGITVAEWARAHGFARMTVMDLLHGRRAGHYGEAHRAAIALGLKRGEVVDVKSFSKRLAKAAA